MPAAGSQLAASPTTMGFSSQRFTETVNPQLVGDGWAALALGASHTTLAKTKNAETTM
jgi:hypothetical protein